MADGDPSAPKLGPLSLYGSSRICRPAGPPCPVSAVSTPVTGVEQLPLCQRQRRELPVAQRRRREAPLSISGVRITPDTFTTWRRSDTQGPRSYSGCIGIDGRRPRTELRIGLIGFAFRNVQLDSTLKFDRSRRCADSSMPL